MSRSIETSVPIAASADRVWEVLVDLARYPEWNPWLTSAKGVVEPAARLTVRMAPPGRKPVTFRPRITHVEPGRELGWRSRAGLPGLYDGARIFRIIPFDGSHCRFEHSERWSGLLVPLVWRFVSAETRYGFVAMNEALATRAEGLS